MGRPRALDAPSRPLPRPQDRLICAISAPKQRSMARTRCCQLPPCGAAAGAALAGTPRCRARPRLPATHPLTQSTGPLSWGAPKRFAGLLDAGAESMALGGHRGCADCNLAERGCRGLLPACKLLRCCSLFGHVVVTPHATCSNVLGRNSHAYSMK